MSFKSKFTIKRISAALNKISLEAESQKVPSSWQEYVLQESEQTEFEINNLSQKPKLLPWQEYLTKLGRKLGK